MKGVHVGREFGAPKWVHTAARARPDPHHVARREARQPVARPARRSEHRCRPPEPGLSLPCAASPGSPAPTPSCSNGCCARSCTAGPTAQGIDIGPHFSIGMRRLAIIDVATGDQPLYSDDRNLALVFNGEIYNHARAAPRARSHGPAVRHRPLRHRSDPARLRGVGYARRRPPHRACSRSRSPTASSAELFLARDRLGIKPLYYVDGPGRLRVRVGAEGAVPGRAACRRQPDLDVAPAVPAVPRARRRRRHLLRRRASGCSPGTRCSCGPTAS